MSYGSLTGADINQADKEGQTPLYICVQNAFVHSSYAAVECLLSAGASIDKYVKKYCTGIHTIVMLQYNAYSQQEHQ